MLDWLETTEFADNSLLMWAFALGGSSAGFLLVAAALGLVRRQLHHRQAAAAHPVRGLMIAVIGATRYWLVLLLALVIGAGFLRSSPHVTAWLAHLAFGLWGLQLALWANAVIRHWLHRKENPLAASVNPVFLNMLTWGAWILVWSTLLLAFLANLGVNITAFVASLGVGGVAVALALQNILGDLFSSIAIGLDKPFEVGEFIAFGDVLGTVIHVGVKTTRIASLSGEQLVIANSDLLKELIHNYSRMPKRRVVFGFQVPYASSARDVETIVTRTREFIEAEDKVQFDRGHLLAFGESGFRFEFVYYVLDPDYTLYCDIQQRVNFRIMELLEGLDVAFAVPVRHIVPAAGRLGANELADAQA